VRSAGRFVASRKVKGSRMTLAMARETYKQNKTFYPEIQRTQLKNTSEYRYLPTATRDINAKRPVARPRGKIWKNAQYEVTGTFVGTNSNGVFKRQSAVGRSHALTLRFTENEQALVNPNTKSAMLEARKIFWQNLAEKVTGNYDEDEGLSLADKVKNYKEGWVAYG
jgi:hypothetical protein